MPFTLLFVESLHSSSILLIKAKDRCDDSQIYKYWDLSLRLVLKAGRNRKWGLKEDPDISLGRLFDGHLD
jgi:hypothetical protein